MSHQWQRPGLWGAGPLEGKDRAGKPITLRDTPTPTFSQATASAELIEKARRLGSVVDFRVERLQRARDYALARAIDDLSDTNVEALNLAVAALRKAAPGRLP